MDQMVLMTHCPQSFQSAHFHPPVHSVMKWYSFSWNHWPPRGVATLEHEVNFFSCFDAVRGFVKWRKSAWRLSSLWLPKWGFLPPSIHPWASPKKRRVSVGLQMGSKPFLPGQLDSSACWWIPEKSRKSRRENCVQRRQILHDDSKDSRGLDLLRWMSSPGICE